MTQKKQNRVDTVNTIEVNGWKNVIIGILTSAILTGSAFFFTINNNMLDREDKQDIIEDIRDIRTELNTHRSTVTNRISSIDSLLTLVNDRQQTVLNQLRGR